MEAFAWLQAHPEVLVNAAASNTEPGACIGAIDLRLAHGVQLDSQTVNMITARNGAPVWITVPPVSDLAEEIVRAGLLAAILHEWDFPADFVAMERATFQDQCAVGGPFRNRDVVVVAYGHEASVALTHPAQFSHAILIARVAGQD